MDTQRCSFSDQCLTVKHSREVLYEGLGLVGVVRSPAPF